MLLQLVPVRSGTAPVYLAATMMVLVGVVSMAHATQYATWTWNNRSGGNWGSADNWTLTYGSADAPYYWDEFTWSLGGNVNVNSNASDMTLGLVIGGPTSYSITGNKTQYLQPSSATTDDSGYGPGVVFIQVWGTGSDSFAAPITVGNQSGTNLATGFVIEQDQTYAGNVFTVSGNINGGTVPMTVQGAGNTTISGVISDVSLLTMNGSGTLTLSGNNTYSGSTTLTSGLLQIGNNAALGAGGLTLNGGTLQGGISVSLPTSNSVTLTADSMVAGSNSITIAGPFTNSGGTNTLTNAMTGGALTLSGNLNLSETPSVGRTLWIASETPNTTTVLNGTISDCNGGGAASSLTLAPRSYGDTIVLNAANNYSGDTNLGGNYHGCIIVNNDSAFGNSTVHLNKTLLQAGVGPVTIAN